jgi:hypothetical protein
MEQNNKDTTTTGTERTSKATAISAGSSLTTASKGLAHKKSTADFFAPNKAAFRFVRSSKKNDSVVTTTGSIKDIVIIEKGSINIPDRDQITANVGSFQKKTASKVDFAVATVVAAVAKPGVSSTKCTTDSAVTGTIGTVVIDTTTIEVVDITEIAEDSVEDIDSKKGWFGVIDQLIDEKIVFSQSVQEEKESEPLVPVIRNPYKYPVIDRSHKTCQYKTVTIPTPTAIVPKLGSFKRFIEVPEQSIDQFDQQSKMGPQSQARKTNSRSIRNKPKSQLKSSTANSKAAQKKKANEKDTTSQPKVQITFDGKRAFDPLKDCIVCKKTSLGLPAPHRGHHEKCPKNKKTKGGTVSERQFQIEKSYEEYRK